MELHPYPDDVMPAVHTVLAYLRGTEPAVPVVEVGHAVWHLAGFALSQFDHHDATVTVVGKADEADLRVALESLDQGLKTAIDWSLLLPILLDLLLRLIKK
jgi:hypothetical protein